MNLLIKPFYVFGIERVIQDRVGAETYGLYATLFSFAFLLFMVNDFGIHYFNNRTIAQHPQLVGKYFPQIFLLKIWLSVFYIGLVFVAALVRGFEFSVFYLLFFVALNHALISMVAYFRSNISGLGRYREDSVVSTLDKIFLIGLCAILLWANPFAEGEKFDIKWFVHAQNIAWGLTAGIAFFLIYRQVPIRIKWRANLPFLLVILKKSFPFALAVFLMTAYTRLDIVILEWLIPDGRFHAGVYAASYRLLDAFNMVGYLFAGLLLPMFSRLLSTPGSRAEIPPLLRLSLQLVWAGTVTLAVSCFFFQQEIMALMYPLSVNAGNVGYYGETMGYLILTLIPFSGVFIYSTLLTANDSLKKMNRLFLIGILVNVGLNLLLIPSLAATGAAIAAFATQAFVLLAMMWLARQELQLPFTLRQTGKIAGFFVLTIFACRQISQWPADLDWELKFVLCMATGASLAFLFRLIRLKMLIDLVKKKEGLA